ncbi:hypothetical protein P8C59_002764 [Phyllachora maydis]|uniref:Cytochrome c oxidase subunit 4, mitochondrial n=1 Tax=Phyllachora maydis TaxID=1825666 RepID=A0AAD9MAN7_9PEZI|nr:hypothetical protein P8C59_002764 [Phyllachora maydis]
MFLSRSAIAVARRAAVAPALRRGLATTAVRCNKVSDTKVAHDAKDVPDVPAKPPMKTLSEVKSFDDLFGPGAADGTVPTDLEQSTGLERLEILGKVEGVDIFDMRPLDASRKGTMEDPILVPSGGDEQLAGCTGYPADSHIVHWLGLSRTRPIERCPECGSVYKMQYIGPLEDEHGHDDHGHGHDHHGWTEPKTWADFVRPEYTCR